MTARVPAGTLDQDVTDTLNLLADTIDAAKEWAELEVAGGKPPKWVIRELGLKLSAIARATRGQGATS